MRTPLLVAVLLAGQVTPPRVQVPVAPIPPDELTLGPFPPLPVSGGPVAWLNVADYPPAAIRAGAQGRVSARLAIDRTGRVTECAVVVSSGSVDLDSTTCRLAVARGRFFPAKDANGAMVDGNFTLTINWRLPTASPADATTTLISIGPDGAVRSCASMTPTPLGDLCAAFPAGRQLDVPAAMRGTVVALTASVRPLAQ